MTMPPRFAPDFLFGAATAAYQVEGAAFEDGRTASIWDAFARIPGAVIDADNGDVAVDQYHRYRDDVALMRELGIQAYRFSSSWSRVRPDGGAPNPKGIDYYERLVDALLEAGIAPWLTLYHWDMPQALEERGGWTSRDTVDRFVEYAATMHEALGDRVETWTTLNEPWCSSFLSYTAGAHAPGRQSVEDGLLASHHLLLAHGTAARELRGRGAQRIGITLNLTNAIPVDPADDGDADAARRIDGQFNRWFLDPLLRGSHPRDVVDDIRAVDPSAVDAFEAAVEPGDLATISSPIDFLGVNYYHGEYVSATPDAVPVRGGEAPTERPTRSPYPSHEGIHWRERGLPRTGMGWEIEPAGLTSLLERVAREYTALPLYVTENGAAFDDVVGPDGGIEDRERAQYLRDHLAAVAAAIEAGVDVRGYFYWSLVDNFEWAWGYAKRFGIVHVDYETQRRTPKRSAREYQRIIADRAVA